MSRWPAPGRCKRRLAAGIGSIGAARVQARLLQHTLAVARAARSSLPAGELRLVLAAEGVGLRASGRWARAMGMDQGCGQGAGGLGLRLRRQLLAGWRRRATAVLVIGSDLPELEPADLLAAVAALRGAGAGQAPLLLGPAADGGYWLIGMGRPLIPRMSGLLLGGGPQPIDWGSSRVLAQTRAAAAAAGLSSQLLSQRHDLDRPVDLARWR